MGEGSSRNPDDLPPRRVPAAPGADDHANCVMSTHLTAAQAMCMTPSYTPTSNRRAPDPSSPGLIERAAPGAPALIGIAVDGTQSGHDAVALGSLLARPTDAELMLIAIHQEPLYPMVLPKGMSWTSLERQAQAMLVKTRNALAPEARIVVHPDVFVWRGLRHVVRVEHRDLLIAGSARDTAEGTVHLGRTAGELLGHLECPLAVAPSGMSGGAMPRLERIGVGFTRHAESRDAFMFAASIASAAAAELHVLEVLEDSAAPGMRPHDAAIGDEETARDQLISLLCGEPAVPPDTRTRTNFEVAHGSPQEALKTLSTQVDLLVIGSSHAAPRGRVQPGHTGRAMLDGAMCPVMVVPRPKQTHR